MTKPHSGPRVDLRCSSSSNYANARIPLNLDTGKTSFGMTQAVLTLVWTFVFQLSVGQLGWALPAEVGSTRLRQKTVCLARNAYYITSVVGSVLQPYFMNPDAWNLVSDLQIGR